jgi:hypothetical protein
MWTLHRNRTLCKWYARSSIYRSQTTYKNETRWYTIIQIYQHMHFTQIKSHTSATRRRYRLVYDFQFLLCTRTCVGITNDGGRNASNEQCKIRYLQFLVSPQFKGWLPRLLRPLRSLLYLTTLCCHLLSVYSINSLCRFPKSQRSYDGKWRTGVVGQNNVSLLELVLCL